MNPKPEYRNAAWLAIISLVLAGLPSLALLNSVVSYEPSNDWEVTDDQELGRKLIWRYLCLAAVPGVSLCLVIGGRMRRGKPVRQSAPENSEVPPVTEKGTP